MNQDQVKEKLKSIHQSPVDYKVIFSGKKSARVNGFYRPLSKEITIHNRNFIREDGGVNENGLMFTAIHELAHHVMMSEKGDTSARAHNQDFWAEFHGLLDIAEEKGVYRAEIDSGTQKLIDEARDISRRIAELQREHGRVIAAIDESCKKSGVRTEDVIERKAQIGKAAAKTAVAAYGMGDRGVGFDIQTEAAKQRDGDRQEAIIAAGRGGKSVVQAKKSAPPAKPAEAEDESEALIREKRRVERTIESLARRLEEIKEQLAARDKESGGEW
jgi:hypothetical protein